MKDRPRMRIEGPSDQERSWPSETGRVAFDERGNAVWQWADQCGEPPPLERLDLSLAEEAPLPTDIENRKAKVAGYDPYGSGLVSRARVASNRRKDLRELSKWIELRRKVGQDTTG